MPKATDHDLLPRVGARIRELRERAGKTQAVLAEGAGVEPANICRIEAGTLGVSITTLVALAKSLGVQPSVIASALDDGEPALHAAVRTQRARSRAEETLIEAYRGLGERERRAVRQLVATLRRSPREQPAEKQP